MGMWPSKANEAVAPALRSQEGTMAKTDNPEFDGPEVIDRRKLLTAAAATTAASIVPKVTTAEGVCEAIQSSILPPGVRSPKVCATTARRLLEIHRRNELRQAEFRRSCVA
jgi:hypothetical protein